MFTKTIKKYIGLGLVLTFCSASSMAETVVLTAAQYQPVFAAGAYGLMAGIAVTGTTLTGCPAPAYLALNVLTSDGTSSTDAPTPINLHMHAVATDILTKAKAASRPIEVTYEVGGTPTCKLEMVVMQ